ncbi:MAG: hypothetical protein R8K48_07980 [Gallionella sp.]
MQNGWARTKLAHFSGKTVQFKIAPFSFSYTILPDGAIGHADQTISADAQCIIAPSLLPRLVLQDELAYAEIKSTGDTSLLSEIFSLSRTLRWDAAEDLSVMTGDIAAERIVQAAQIKHKQLSAATLNLAQAAAEYWTEERPLLAKPQQISLFMQQVDTIRDDIARLDQRIARLSLNAQKLQDSL